MSMQEINYNSIASYERSGEKRQRNGWLRVFTAILLMVFFIVLATGLAASVAMYQAVANNQAQTNAARMQAGLLANSIHANDTESALGTGNGPEGRSLVLTKTDADGAKYEMRLYLFEGNIVQEYSIAGSAYTPMRAQPLLASKTFDFELHDKLLIIHTDQGATNIALRSSQGGAA